MATRKIVVIGGAHAGPRAAIRARQFDDEAQIIVFEKSSYVNWMHADLGKCLDVDAKTYRSQLAAQKTHIEKSYSIDVRTNTEVIEIDMDARCVVSRSNSSTERVRFDALIFAGGATCNAIQVENLCGDRVAHFKTFEDVVSIQESIAAGAKKAVVIGCGFYGVEAAEALRRVGLHVDIIESAPRIVPKFSLPASLAILRQLKAVGTCVHLSESVVKAQRQKSGGFRLDLKSGAHLDTDLVVVTVGVVPVSKLLAEAGATLNQDGSVAVDSAMMTTLPSVFACGSAVSVPQAIVHERIWFPQPSLVERTAQIAGFNASITAVEHRAELDRLKPVAGTQLLNVGDVWFARTGLTQIDARKHFGEDRIFSSTVHGNSNDEDNSDMSVSLLIDRSKNHVVGGEAWGPIGVSRRIDLIAAAVTEGWAPAKFLDLEMAYSASLGPVFDPLKEAGMLANLSLQGKTKTIAGDRLALWVAQKRPFKLVDVSKLEELRGRLDELDKSVPLVVTSNPGRHALLAQRMLTQRGFIEVYYLDGGPQTWSMVFGAEV